MIAPFRTAIRKSLFACDSPKPHVGVRQFMDPILFNFPGHVETKDLNIGPPCPGDGHIAFRGQLDALADMTNLRPNMNSIAEATTYPVSVKGVLFTPDGNVVLLLNERDEWELPGGRIEPGESSPECLAREIEEELNVGVEVGQPLDTYLFEVLRGRLVFVATYQCRIVGSFEPRLSHEHKRIGLFLPSALPPNLPQGYRASIASVAKVVAEIASA